jgi:hypothetical protein
MDVFGSCSWWWYRGDALKGVPGGVKESSGGGSAMTFSGAERIEGEERESGRVGMRGGWESGWGYKLEVEVEVPGDKKRSTAPAFFDATR